MNPTYEDARIVAAELYESIVQDAMMVAVQNGAEHLAHSEDFRMAAKEYADKFIWQRHWFGPNLTIDKIMHVKDMNSAAPISFGQLSDLKMLVEHEYENDDGVEELVAEWIRLTCGDEE